jgi:hypothetical protein
VVSSTGGRRAIGAKKVELRKNNSKGDLNSESVFKLVLSPTKCAETAESVEGHLNLRLFKYCQICLMFSHFMGEYTFL